MTIPSHQPPAERWAARRSRQRSRRDPRVRAACWLGAALLFFAVTVVYLIEPSKSLPHFLPGYDATSNLHQIAHAVIAGFCGIVTFFGSMIQLVSAGIPDVAKPASSHIHTIPPRD